GQKLQGAWPRERADFDRDGLKRAGNQDWDLVGTAQEIGAQEPRGWSVDGREHAEATALPGRQPAGTREVGLSGGDHDEQRRGGDAEDPLAQRWPIVEEREHRNGLDACENRPNTRAVSSGRGP